MQKIKKNQTNSLDIAKVMEDFQKAESAPGHRKDAFKVEGSFEDAVKRIAKAKPQKPSPRQ